MFIIIVLDITAVISVFPDLILINLAETVAPTLGSQLINSLDIWSDG